MAVQKILNDELTRAKAANPSYSLRAFARKLKVSPATLSLLLNGRRRASKKFASSMSRTLAMDPKQTAELLSLYDINKNRSHSRPEDLRIHSDQFQLISDWYHFAILSLLETKTSKADPDWISRRLNIPSATAKIALDRLERLDLIRLSANDAGGDASSKKEGDELHYVTLTGRPIQTSDDVASTALQKSHAQLLEQAKASLAQDAIEKRDFLSVTMAIDPAKIPQAKILLREFREKVCTYLESGEKSEVYALNIQLIPLSK